MLYNHGDFSSFEVDVIIQLTNSNSLMNPTNPTNSSPYFYFSVPYSQFPSYLFSSLLPSTFEQNLSFPSQQATLKVEQGINNEKTEEKSEKNNKTIKKINDVLYQPKEETNGKTTKKYKKDQNRNIMPNSINQVFSFLEKKFKSQQKLRRVLKLYKLEKYCSVQKYYIYQKVLKSKLNNYLTEEALGELFELVDPIFQIFTLEQQLTFMKINSILLIYYLRGSQNPCRLLCAQKANTDKKPAYLNANRKIESIVKQYMSECQRKFNFEILK